VQGALSAAVGAFTLVTRLPEDPKAAAVLAKGAKPGRGFTTSPLLREAALLARNLDRAQADLAAPPRSAPIRPLAARPTPAHPPAHPPAHSSAHLAVSDLVSPQPAQPGQPARFVFPAPPYDWEAQTAGGMPAGGGS
jgi:hypothetical protein